MFKNKHVVVAMLVAPVLAIMAWFAVDYFIGERPHAAKDGAAYTLVAKSNCRYDSGQCDLGNSDFSLSLRPVSVTAVSIQLELLPSPMSSIANDALRWTAQIDRPSRADAAIRLAVTAQGATWYAEVPVVFMRLANEP